MKKIFKLFVAAALMAVSTSAMAQYVDTDNYMRYQVSFAANRMTNTDAAGFEGINPKGLSAGVILGNSVSNRLPIFVEYGANLHWSHSVKDFASLGDFKFSYMNVAVPLNGVYKYTLNDKVAFSGHAGLNFKVNFMARCTDPTDHKYSLLSKKDMEGRDNRASIFQLGGQIGCGVHLNHFYLGWQYQSDFMPFLKEDAWQGFSDKHKFHTNYITLGYTL